MTALPRPGPVSDTTPFWIATAAAAALAEELETWPKPGLVSLVDSGSHSDMDATTFGRSIDALHPAFAAFATAGAAGTGMGTLRRIGIDAEQAMLTATEGVNTHRGAIFGLGLLAAAAGACGRPRGPGAAARLCATVRERWGAEIARLPVPIGSHGTAVLRRYGVGGARAEAAAGFPSVLRFALPALRAGRTLTGGDENGARVHAFFTLLATLDDTNLLHRGGVDALAFAQAGAARFLAAGGVGDAGWRTRAIALHHDFVGRRLSPGGCADLLGLSLFLDRCETP